MARFRPLQSFGRELHHVIHGVTVAHVDLRNRLLTAFTLTIIIDLILTVLMFKFEGGVKGSNIITLWDAFYFTTSQLTTIGTPMSNPVTTTGQFIGLFMNIYAATVVSTIAGIFGAFFYHITDQRHKSAEATGNPTPHEGDS